MTRFRQSRWISPFLVSVIAFAWIVAFNHCAWAALEGSRKAAHACCHESGSPAPQKGSSMECCNTFHATVPSHLVLPEVQMHALMPAWLESVSAAFAAPAQIGAGLHATGPPRALGFAETVLNRSLLSHAPPCFVA